MTWHPLHHWSVLGEEPKPGPQLWAQASFAPAGLDVRFRLIWTPADATVMVPQRKTEASGGPQRLDGLWQHTCFEVFAGLLGTDSYWEVNLSPSGDWNVYRFSAYRGGQAPELAYGQLPLTVIGPRAAPPVADCRLGAPRALLEVELCCPLPPPLQQRFQSGTAPMLELGLSAVLEGREGELSYWALQHPGRKPDFHDRRGWLLRL
jgi:hypothetical protein